MCVHDYCLVCDYCKFSRGANAPCPLNETLNMVSHFTCRLYFHLASARENMAALLPPYSTLTRVIRYVFFLFFFSRVDHIPSRKKQAISLIHIYNVCFFYKKNEVTLQIRDGNKALGYSGKKHALIIYITYFFFLFSIYLLSIYLVCNFLLGM